MKRLRWEAALVGFVALAATLAATERTPLTWDEGDAFVRAERVAAWTRAVVVGPQKLRETFSAETGETGREERDRRRFGDVERAALEYFARLDGRRSLFSEKSLEAGWPHAIYREGHPAGYSIAIAAGRAFSLRFLPFLSEKAAFRLGPIFLFALALAAVFYRVARNWGRFAAVLAVVGIISIPRAFGHAQLAGGDSLLISSWLLAWAFFDPALASKRGAVALGAAVGVSFCAKFSGFAVLVPLTAGAFAALWSRRRNGARGTNGGKATDEPVDGTRRDGAWATLGRLALAFGVATALFFAANPPLWARPFDGLETFVSLNLRRDGFDIPIYFLGKFYSPSRPLPWWNGFFWLATTVPTGLLAFAALGGVATAFRKIGENNAVAEVGKSGAVADVDENNAVAVVGESGANDEDAGTTNEGDANGVDERSEFGGRRLAGLALAFAATLPLVRVIPGIPTHDGARLLIASFPFVAILAAFGATFFVDWRERTAAATAGRAFRREEATLNAALADVAELERDSSPEAANEYREKVLEKWEERRKQEEPKRRRRRAKTARRLAQVVVASAFAIGVVDLVRSAPQYLSFYNATLGGVVGATRRGMEATYYWDAFDADAVAWLNAEIADARSAGRPSGVLFGSFSSQTLDYYRRWGTLATSEIETLSTPNVFANRERFGFYVVQRRPSGWTALELSLFKTARPIWRKTVRNPLDLGGKNVGRRKVVLLEIYDFRDVEGVLSEAKTTSLREENAEATP